MAYVLIGGLAGRLHGSPTLTNDTDLSYARDGDDLIRMKRAAGRPSDRIELEVLTAVREETDAAGGIR